MSFLEVPLHPWSRGEFPPSQVMFLVSVALEKEEGWGIQVCAQCIDRLKVSHTCDPSRDTG